LGNEGGREVVRERVEVGVGGGGVGRADYGREGRKGG